MTNLFCSLKSNHKVFYLNRDIAASCCRADGDVIGDRSVFELVEVWKKQSQDLANGVKIDDCRYCWKDENSGKQSYRQIHRGKFNNHIEICFDTLCNHMCSYCSPKFSSVWSSNIEKFGLFELIPESDRQNLEVPDPVAKNNSERFFNHLLEYINTCEPHSVGLAILGGEPLMQVKSLKRLFSAVSDKIQSVVITTNLNPPSPKFLHYILDQTELTERLKFRISIDSTPDFNHVPRWGFNRQSFLNNLDLLNQHKISYMINAVVSALSVFDLPEFIEWIQQRSIVTNFSNLYNPTSLTVSSLPKNLRNEIIDAVPAGALPDHILQELVAPEPDWLAKKNLRSYMTQYFQRTGLHPESIENERFQRYWQAQDQ